MNANDDHKFLINLKFHDVILELHATLQSVTINLLILHRKVVQITQQTLSVILISISINCIHIIISLSPLPQVHHTCDNS